MLLGGIDGCRFGWIIVTYDGHDYSYSLHSTFNKLIKTYPNCQRILIDIPIGLSSPGFSRTIEAVMRKELPGRSSTVFNAPCRASVYEPDDHRARALNIAVEGKSLSKQSLNIRDKIKQVDESLTNANTQLNILESHPEICFKYLANGVVMSRKSTYEGVEERLDILEKYDQRLPSLYHHILSNEFRRDVKADDIIDAICLCLVNQLSINDDLSRIEDENKIDAHKIGISIAYFIPSDYN